MHSLSDTHPQSYLSWFLKGLLLLSLLVLFTRLAELTVIKGEYYRTLAEGNRIRNVSFTAPRGKILDRNGEVLAGSVQVNKTVIFDPIEGYSKATVTDNTPQDEIIQEWERNYPMNMITSHLIGYLGEVDALEVGKADPGCLEKGPRALGSLKGRSGLESQYECQLRGVNGEELVEVDIEGHKIRTVGRKPAIPGRDIKTTIDAKLQLEVAKAMDGVIGAAVATDSQGQVLALFSAPSFDPLTDLQKLLADENLPLFNRAITGVYHPGSVFKIVTATAALESGKVTPDFEYTDTGNVTVNEFNYTTWYFTQYGRTEGKINISKALARSTDTFFYKVGEFIGPELLASWAEKFGVGHRSEIDLPGESSGLLATPEWKQNTLGERWYLGNTYHMSIGQGDLTTTPLQANLLTAVIASDGKWCKPYIDQQVKANCVDINISPLTLATVKKGMVEACATGGTAYPFFDFATPVACKTGTAETGDPEKNHAWFTIIAPVDEPQIVLTVLVEKGGEGSKVAAPIARKILDYWFYGRPQ